MNRLWVRLTLAFIVLTQLPMLVIALFAGFSVTGDFQRYVIVKQNLSTLGDMPQNLQVFYQQQGNWDGVEKALPHPVTVQSVGNEVAAPDVSSAPVAVARPAPSDGNSVYTFQVSMVLADASGKVIYDTSGEHTGAVLSSAQLADSVPIAGNSEGRPVGYLLSKVPPLTPDVFMHAPEQNFLAQLRHSLLIAAVIAAGISIVMGLIISRTIVGPLRVLADAAHAFAAHNWQRRIKIRGTREIRAVAYAFNQMADEIQRAETVRRSLMADIAHELRTPLTVMQATLQALLDGVYALTREEIASLYDETLLLGRLVEDIRELTLADAGQLRLNAEAVDVGKLLRTIVEDFAVAAESKNVALALTLDNTLPTIQADLCRLTQIMRNLMLNALRHTSTGAITISAKPEPEQHRLAIHVIDTGEGMDGESLEHLFDRFYRADKSRDRAGGGTGLGLAITKAWVEAMGGTIKVESTLGEGSHFWFTVPLKSRV